MTDTIQAISRSLNVDIATLNTISNNIANSGTPGFRAERSLPSFQAHLDGSQSQDSTASSISIDQSDGPVSETGRSLDLALRGQGFFEVQRGSETLLIRAGNFRLDADGRLVNGKGDLVLGAGGPISLDTEHVRVDAKGAIWSGDKAMGELKLVGVAEPEKLVPSEGAFRYDGALSDFRGRVQQGALEHTNVNIADQSIRLMELTRHVESVQRAISIYDKAMDTGINHLGEN